MMSNEEFLALDESFRSFISEYGRFKLAYNTVVYFLDINWGIRIHFSPWVRQNPEDRREEASVAYVIWNDIKYRFYFQIFYLPEDNGDNWKMRDVIWTIFKIEVVGNQLFTENSIKKNIEKIIYSLKTDVGSEYANKVIGIEYVSEYFENRPIELIGE